MMRLANLMANRDEGQDGVADMICELFQQQGTPKVEVDKFSGNL